MSMAAQNPGDYEIRPLTADEVLEMVAAGILDPGERVELLDGELVVMSPQKAPHQWTATTLQEWFREVFTGAAHVRGGTSISAGRYSLPEPDVVVVRGSHHEYKTRLPGGADIIVVVEVCHTTRTRDLRKAGIYARAGIPVYWLVDIDRRTVTIYSEPADDEGYRQMRTLGEDDVITAPESDASWPVRDLLP
jgi:Uma2 family endonuclease